MAKEKVESAQRIVTPEFRVSFPHVHKPSAMKGAKPKYSVVMLFPKNKDLSVVKLAIKAAKIEKFGPNKDEWPTGVASPVVDGDEPKYANYEGYAGNWAIKASSNEDSKPGCVDYPDANDIIVPSDFYPGCFARAQVFARVWEFPEGSGRFGVHFILDHVQKMKEGKAFGGKKSAKEAFGATAGAADDDEDENDDGGF